MTAVQPLYGQMADCVGRKIPLILSVIIFAGGSAIAGAAKAPASMILGRVVQGCGTGGIDLFAELILTDIVPLRQRGKYLAWKNSVFALGTLLGPLLGGYFAEHNWRWCFWINLPVSAFALGLILIWLDVDSGKDADSINSVERERKPWDIDFIGAGTITASVSLFLYAFATGGTMVPWGSDKVVIPLVFGIFGTLGFIFWERCSYCKYPMMPPYIFSNRTSATAFALTAVHGFIIYGFQFFLPLYFQAVQGSPPKKSGYQVLPSTVSIVVMAAAGGPLLSRTGKYRGIQQIGFGALAFGLGFFTRLGTHTNMAEWLIIQLIAGFGSGIVVSTMLPAILVKLPDSANGSAAGSWAFLRGIGSLLGVAWPSAVFNLRVSKMLPGIEDAHIRRILDNGHAYQQAASDDLVHASPAVKKQVVDMFQKALRDVWIMFTILAIVAFALTFFERQLEMRKNLDTKFGLRQKPCKRRVGSSEGFIDAGVEKGGLSSGAAAAGSNNTSETSGATTLVDPDLEKQALKESPFEAAGGGDDEIRAVASGSGGRRRIQNHRQPQQHQNRNGDQDEIYGEPEVDSDSDFGAEESEKRGPDEEDGDCGSAARDAKRQSHSSFDEFWHHWRSARRSVGAAGGVVGSSISNAVSNSFLRRGDEGGGGSGPGRGGVRRRVSAAGVV